MDLLRISNRVAGVRVSSITCDPNRIFLYLPLDESFSQICRGLIEGVNLPDLKTNDHLTLLYLKEQSCDVGKLLPNIVDTCKAVSKHHSPLKAKLQGWAYFDGAENDGQKATALVGLVDVPGLEDLHVDVKRACKDLGLDVTQNHGFNCHTTFCYLPHGARIEELPVLSHEFTLNKFCLSNDKIYEFNL